MDFILNCNKNSAVIMESNLKDLMARLTNQTSDNIRPACKKCGYPGHFTYQCRNFLQINPHKDIVLDISSTSSESEEEFVSPLVKLREEEKKTDRKKKTKKGKISKDKRSKSRRKSKSKSAKSSFNSHSSSDSNSYSSAKHRKKAQEYRRSRSAELKPRSSSVSESDSDQNEFRHKRHDIKHKQYEERHNRYHRSRLQRSELGDKDNDSSRSSSVLISKHKSNKSKKLKKHKSKY